MRNVFIFHSMGSTSRVKYLKWGISTLCLCLMPIVTSWFENVVSLLLPTWLLLKFWKPTSSLCFLSPHGIYLSREKKHFRSFKQQACWARWMGSSVLSLTGLFISVLITLETFWYALINSLSFYRSQTLPLKITWYPLPLVRCQVWWTFPKNHFSSRWPVEVVASTVILNCLLFLSHILLLR